MHVKLIETVDSSMIARRSGLDRLGGGEVFTHVPNDTSVHPTREKEKAMSTTNKSWSTIAVVLTVLAMPAGSRTAAAQTTFDLAADFSALQNPNGAWSFGWMPSGNTTFTPYTTSFAAFGLNLNEWRGPFPDYNGSAPPDVMFNPTGNPITVETTTWLPNRVTFHPGEHGERSVIRWTSPLAGPGGLTAAFEGRSHEVTTRVEIYHNGGLLFASSIFGAGSASRKSFAGPLMLQPGDTIDFRVDYGNGNWHYDTTQIDVVITPEPTTLSLLALAALAAIRRRP
ncbi:MAG: PEP-CTERM sorting domain-containing protein [Planctomycetes bacterium]|nr:PEP-CTERM sorting domain-containing protein [Planctomycetota bacterium]